MKDPGLNLFGFHATGDNPLIKQLAVLLGQKLYGNLFPQQAIISPMAQRPIMPTATPTPTPDQGALEQVINQGFINYGAPMATAAAHFAEAGNTLKNQYGKVDPLLPAILSLKETSGGKRMAPNSANNVLNIGPNINYPDIRTNLMGGGTWGPGGRPQRGFMGVMQHPAYQKYLQSGDLNDFFQTYTPPAANNASVSDQVNQYNTLRKQFLQNIDPNLLKKAGIQ